MIERAKTYLEDSWIDKLKSYEITDTKYVDMFEEKLKAYISISGIPHVVNDHYVTCTCNATSAILLGCIALGMDKTKKCLLPGYSYPAVKTILKFLNVNIDYIDINSNTLCMDPELLKKYLDNNKTDFVFFINHLGYVGDDLFEIKKICDHYKVTLIEDSAHGLGQIYKHKHAGTIGKFGVYSFSGTKLLRAGSGGCFITSDKELNKEVRRKRNIGPGNIGIGNYEMSPVGAILLLEQLENIEILFFARERAHKYYKKYGLDLVEYPTDYSRGYHSCAYIAKSMHVNKLGNFLERAGYEVRYKFYRFLSGNKYKTPVSFCIFNKYIELPQGYNVEHKDFRKIINIIKALDKEGNYGI